jgi:small subunit ribosomal protein S16
MAVKIRLMRMGAKHQPSYRVVVADSRTPRGGRYLEALGHYNPRREPSVIQIDEDKARAWLDRGARPSDSARVLLQKTGIWQRWEAGRSGKA